MPSRLTPQEQAAHRVSIKRAHELFRRGDPLDNDQIRVLIEAIEAAEPLLSIPAYATAQYYAAHDLVRLKEMREERSRRGRG